MLTPAVLQSDVISHHKNNHNGDHQHAKDKVLKLALNFWHSYHYLLMHLIIVPLSFVLFGSHLTSHRLRVSNSNQRSALSLS